MHLPAPPPPAHIFEEDLPVNELQHNIMEMHASLLGYALLFCYSSLPPLALLSPSLLSPFTLSVLSFRVPFPTHIHRQGEVSQWLQVHYPPSLHPSSPLPSLPSPSPLSSLHSLTNIISLSSFFTSLPPSPYRRSSTRTLQLQHNGRTAKPPALTPSSPDPSPPPPPPPPLYNQPSHIRHPLRILPLGTFATACLDISWCLFICERATCA